MTQVVYLEVVPAEVAAIEHKEATMRAQIEAEGPFPAFALRLLREQGL